VISQHILGEFHYFTVHGPEHLSWSLLSIEHFSAMLQNLWSKSNPHFKFHYTEQLHEGSDSLAQQWSMLWSLIVHPETTCTQLYPVHHCSHYKLFSSTVELHTHLNLETGYPDRIFMGFLTLHTDFRRPCQMRPLMLLSQCVQFTVH